MDKISMAKHIINFTKANIDSLPIPPENTRVTYYDSKTNGLQLRISSNGVKTFSVYRWVAHEGKPERVTLGKYPEKSIEKAREDALKINAAIANKENPASAIRVSKAEMTFKELFEIYYERWSKPHKKSWFEDRDKFKLHIEPSGLAKKKLSKITKTDIGKLHSDIGKNHPTTANRTLALISSVFGRAIEWGLWDKVNPATGIRKFPEKSRDRFIQSNELPLFFEALAMEGNETLQDYYMLLLMTGVRKTNLMAMRWDEINLERKEWRIPETKNGTPQTISLDDGHGVMMTILEKRHQQRKLEKSRSAWVFPSDSASGHLAEPRKGWERTLMRAEILQLISLIAEHENWKAETTHTAKYSINASLEKALLAYRKQATALYIDISNVGLRDLRIHDLRRTLGSWMAGTGASTVIIGKQLNQKSPSATAIYARLQLDPVKEARNKAVSAMLGTVGMGQKAEVIAMKGKI